MPVKIETTPTNSADISCIPRNAGKKNPIAIDNDNFDDDHDFLIETRNIQELLVQIQNTGANGLSYEVHGSIDPANEAPEFSTITWKMLEDASGNIAANSNEIIRSITGYVWVLVRLKRRIIGMDTTAIILITSGAFS